MIVGLGIDLVELDRIERVYTRYGKSFAEKILHPDELAVLPEGAQVVPYLAARFAAKEAGSKALGTGFRQGIWFQDFCVKNGPLGQPALYLHGPALAAFERLGAQSAHLSLSHSRHSAAAVVILEK